MAGAASSGDERPLTQQPLQVGINLSRIGLGLALSPFAIAWQERRGTHGDDSSPERVTVVSLYPDWARLRTWPPRDVPWAEVTASMVADIPEPARVVVQHYLDHPEHREELGDRAGLRRAQKLSAGSDSTP